MTLVRFIGDSHGKYFDYHMLIKSSIEPTVQVGDFGMGFYSVKDKHIIDELAKSKKDRFIRGNHDNPAACLSSANYIKDGTIEDNILYIGGAWSIDREWRTEGLDWWADEELSYAELNRLTDVYSIMKPEIMVTHDCPHSIAYNLFVGKNGNAYGKDVIATRTGQAFEAMFALHKPKLWIFGHWHMNRIETIENTTFVCLNELNHIVVNTETATLKTGIQYE